MKKALFLFLCFACVYAHAQEAVSLSHYVFTQFEPGKVLQKDGSVNETKLNYNVLSKEMIFEAKPNQYLALAEPNKIDTVIIAGRKFVPVNNEFYELLTIQPYPLLLQYTCTIKEPGSDIGYGMSSVTTASPAIKSLIQSGGAYSLKLPDGFQVSTMNNYWVLANGKLQKANNAKQLASALPAVKDKINELAKKNNTNFSKKDDIVKLVSQL
ncbi:MAG: hypothetical protein QM726_19805 [Chitinophagaceae bacterium]